MEERYLINGSGQLEVHSVMQARHGAGQGVVTAPVLDTGAVCAQRGGQARGRQAGSRRRDCSLMDAHMHNSVCSTASCSADVHHLAVGRAPDRAQPHTWPAHAALHCAPAAPCRSRASLPSPFEWCTTGPKERLRFRADEPRQRRPHLPAAAAALLGRSAEERKKSSRQQKWQHIMAAVPCSGGMCQVFS